MINLLINRKINNQIATDLTDVHIISTVNNLKQSEMWKDIVFLPFVYA